MKMTLTPLAFSSAMTSSRRLVSVNVRLEVDQGSLVAAHIGGTAVIVSEGTLAL